MPSWYKLLPMEIKDMPESDIIEPDVDVRPSEHVVIDMDISLELKKLYTLSVKFHEEAEKNQLAAKYCRDPQNKERLQVQANEYLFKAHCVSMIFWVSLREESHLWSQNMTDIRKGWKVVWEEPPSFPFFPLK
jgi:hypothetical protein